MGNRAVPDGHCPTCSGELVWSRVRYQPSGWADGARVDAGWIGLDPVCAATLVGASHPCRPAEAPAAATATRTPVSV